MICDTGAHVTELLCKNVAMKRYHYTVSIVTGAGAIGDGQRRVSEFVDVDATVHPDLVTGPLNSDDKVTGSFGLVEHLQHTAQRAFGGPSTAVLGQQRLSEVVNGWREVALLEFNQRRNNVKSWVALVLENFTHCVHVDILAAPLHHARL